MPKTVDHTCETCTYWQPNAAQGDGPPPEPETHRWGACLLSARGDIAHLTGMAFRPAFLAPLLPELAAGEEPEPITLETLPDFGCRRWEPNLGIRPGAVLDRRFDAIIGGTEPTDLPTAREMAIYEERIDGRSIFH